MDLTKGSPVIVAIYAVTIDAMSDLKHCVDYNLRVMLSCGHPADVSGHMEANTEGIRILAYGSSVYCEVCRL